MKKREVLGRRIIDVKQTGHTVPGGGVAWNVEEITLDNGIRLVPLAVQNAGMDGPVVELLIDPPKRSAEALYQTCLARYLGERCHFRV